MSAVSETQRGKSVLIYKTQIKKRLQNR